MGTDKKQNNNKEIDLSDFLDKDLLEFNVSATTFKEVTQVLISKLISVYPGLEKSHSSLLIYEALEQREKIQTTAMGNGIAFPHARIEGLDKFYLMIGVCPEGIEWKSIDGKLVNIVCLMISPLEETYTILKVMAALARLFNDKNRVAKIIECKNILTLNQILRESNISVSSRIVASDIMRPVGAVAMLDDSLQAIAYKMHLNQLDMLPVLDEKGFFAGTVSCLDILKFGIPDFFLQLKTVSFVKHIDPFEKYFQSNKNLKVSAIFKAGTKEAILSDTSLMEIIFQITARNRSSLYVLEKGILKGAIDRFNIIDKILIE